MARPFRIPRVLRLPPASEPPALAKTPFLALCLLVECLELPRRAHDLLTEEPVGHSLMVSGCVTQAGTLLGLGCLAGLQPLQASLHRTDR